MPISPQDLAALDVSISFAAGLNAYATILALGLMARMQWVQLPSGLHALGDTWVLVACGVLFAAEFVADKIPGFDLVWNAAHTFIRVPLAALLAFGATTHLSPGLQLPATLLGAAIAALGHSSKIAARAMVTASPEPVSNVALSVGGDAVALGLTWAATHHPLLAAAAVAIIVLTMVLLIRAAARALGRRLEALKADPLGPLRSAFYALRGDAKASSN